MITRRHFAALAGAGLASGFTRPPAGLRLGGRRDLWRRADGPHLRGAVFAQRRVYRDLDGPSFMGPGAVGAPITEEALTSLAGAGANLAVWSGPGPFAETAPFQPDPQIETHIEDWLERCRRAGLYTVLGFRSGPGRSAFAFHPDEDWYPARLHDDSLWRDEAKQAAWIEMALWAARRFSQAPALVGILPMVEPNGGWLGRPAVWPAMARALARRWPEDGVPLLLSPDGWADLDSVTAFRGVVGSEPVLVGHSYAPREYTHQSSDAPVPWKGGALALPGEAAGDWACLEFGAVNHAPGQAAYLERRIEEFEQAGAGWAAFHWSSGWQEYDRVENAMALDRDPGARSVLTGAFSQNRRRPA